MEFSVFETAQIAIDLLLIVAVGYCVPKLKGYGRMVQLMTADSKVVPTDAKLTEEWAKVRDCHEKGSPKWIAYTNRLKEVGYEK